MLGIVAVVAGAALIYYLSSGKPSTPRQRYEDMRARAIKSGDAMARAFADSQRAYEIGERKRAKELSEEGKAHRAEMERLNLKASEMVFKENNSTRPPGEVDLHDLYVKEAILFTDRSIQEARRRGDSEIKLIVGKGLHSTGAAKVRPAIEELMQKNRLVAALDERNTGVLIVQLDADKNRARSGRVMNSEDIARKLDKKEEGCFIM